MKSHGCLTRFGKVKLNTPIQSKTNKRRKKFGRAGKRKTFNKRFKSKTKDPLTIPPIEEIKRKPSNLDFLEDFSKKKVYLVPLALHEKDSWCDYSWSFPKQKNPLGPKDRIIRKERESIRQTKVHFELTGELLEPKDYSKPFKIKRKVSNDTRWGWLRTVKRLPHLVDGLEVNRINNSLTGFGVKKRRIYHI